MSTSLRVASSSYIDTNCDLRTLVSIANERGHIVQTIGSWLTVDPILPEVIKACVYTLNAIDSGAARVTREGSQT